MAGRKTKYSVCLFTWNDRDCCYDPEFEDFDTLEEATARYNSLRLTRLKYSASIDKITYRPDGSWEDYTTLAEKALW